MAEQTNQLMETQEVTPQAEVSIEDRLMNAMGEIPEEEQEQEVEQEEAEGEDEAEDSEEEQTDEESDDLEEIEIDGETWQVPKALKDGFLRQQDYTQKTQEVSNERKAVQAEREAIMAERQSFQNQVQAQQQNFQVHAQIASVDQQIAQYQNIDWQQLGQADPQKANELRWQLSELKDNRNQLVQTAIQSQQQLTQQQEQARQKAIQENVQQLQQRIPEWNEQMYAELMQYAVSEYGYPEELVANEIDARTWHMAHKAWKYDQLMASKPNIKNKVSNAPKIVKTGAKQPKQSTEQTLRKVVKTSKDRGVKNAAIQKILESRL
jgi:hypothetical protein